MKYFSLILILTSLISSSVFSETATLQTPVKEDQDVVRTLEFVRGNHDFKNLFFKEHEQEFLRLVKEGQSPKTCFISCSDSRVIPELIAQAMPGDFFVIRTAGNFVPTYSPDISWDGVAATIEYAVEVLGVKDIIVCGHSQCGAIQGLFSNDIEKNPKYRILSRWLQFGQDAKRITNRVLKAETPDRDRYHVAELISVLSQLDHLLGYPFIKEKVEAKQIYLHGWHFTIETGEISYFDPETYRFLPISRMINGLDQSLNQEQKK